MLETITLTVISTIAVLASIGGTIETTTANPVPVILDGHYSRLPTPQKYDTLKHGRQVDTLPELSDVDVQALGNDVYTIALYVDGVDGPAYIFEMAGDNSKATPR